MRDEPDGSATQGSARIAAGPVSTVPRPGSTATAPGVSPARTVRSPKVDRRRTLRIFARRLGLSLRSDEERRLRPILTASRRQLEQRRLQVGDVAWLDAAERLMDAAHEALALDHDPGTAWACYLAARREELASLNAEQVPIVAAALRHEASEKLSGWRSDAVVVALKTAEDQRVPLPGRISALQQAVAVEDEESQDRYFRLRELRKQLQSMGWILGFAVVATFVALARGPSPLTEPPDSTDFDTWLLVVLFGILGGSFSAIRSITQERRQARIPEQLTRSAIAAFRPLLGGVAAVAAYAFLGAGLISLSPDALGTVLAVAFASGFSERLIVSAVGAVTHGQGADERTGAGGNL